MNSIRMSVLLGRQISSRTNSVLSSQVRMMTMTSLQNRFTDTTIKIATVFEKTTTDEKLKIYALYKQATAGKNSKPKPKAVDFEGAAKWKAWTALGDMTQEQAKQGYIDLVNQLLTKAGKDPVA